MSKTFVSGGGDKVKLYVALLPLGDRTEPKDAVLETASAVAAGATTIPLDNALAVSIAAGTPLTFVGTSGAKTTVYLTKDAKVGANQIFVEIVLLPIAIGAVANYTAKLRLLGGTQMSVQTNAQRAETMVFEDSLGYGDGVITKQSWQIPWTANLLADDEAYQRVYFANITAVSGREVFVWQQDPPPAGYATGDGLKGTCVVSNFTKQMNADGIVTFNCEFMGQGAPTIARHALSLPSSYSD